MSPPPSSRSNDAQADIISPVDVVARKAAPTQRDGRDHQQVALASRIGNRSFSRYLGRTAGPAVPGLSARSAQSPSPDADVVALSLPVANQVRSQWIAAHRQAGAPVQRQPPDPPAPDTNATAATQSDPDLIALGERLRNEFSNGISLAVYDAHSTERGIFKGKAKEWAGAENAVHLKKVTASPSPQQVGFGKPIPDSQPLHALVTGVKKVLKEAVTAAAHAKDPNAEVDLAPAKISTLAIFAHGTPGWLGHGSGIERAPIKKVGKQIGPALASDAKVILYACRTGDDPAEGMGWKRGTTDAGGADSLAGDLRDALVDAGLPNAEVWAHAAPASGDATRNPAKRIFSTALGKGVPGWSFLSTRVFPPPWPFTVAKEIIAAADQAGYEVGTPSNASDSDESALGALGTDDVRTTALEIASNRFYACWNKAKDRDLRVKGHNVVTAAPLYPDEVATTVRNHWTNSYWPANKTNAAEKLKEKANLKKR